MTNKGQKNEKCLLPCAQQTFKMITTNIANRATCQPWTLTQDFVSA